MARVQKMATLEELIQLKKILKKEWFRIRFEKVSNARIKKFMHGVNNNIRQDEFIKISQEIRFLKNDVINLIKKPNDLNEIVKIFNRPIIRMSFFFNKKLYALLHEKYKYERKLTRAQQQTIMQSLKTIQTEIEEIFPPGQYFD